MVAHWFFNIFFQIQNRPQGEIYQWPRSRNSFRNHETT